MKTKIRFLIALSGLVGICMLMSCENDEIPSNINDSLVLCGEALLDFDSETYNEIKTDSSAVKNIRLEGTCLIVDFAYSGCGIHNIDAMGYINMVSLMPFMSVKLIHDNDDLCLAFFEHSDTFDLSTIEHEGWTNINLQVFEWDELLLVEF